MEEFGDAGRVGDTELDDGENAELHIEPLTLFGDYPLFWFEQGVERLNKVGEDIEKSVVEIGIHLLELFAGDVLVWVGEGEDIFRVAATEVNVDPGAERLETGYVRRI